MVQNHRFLNYNTNEDKPFVSKQSLLFLMLTLWTSVVIMVLVTSFIVMYNFPIIKRSWKIYKDRWGSGVPRVSVLLSRLSLCQWGSVNPVKIYLDARLARQTNCSERDFPPCHFLYPKSGTSSRFFLREGCKRTDAFLPENQEEGVCIDHHWYAVSFVSVGPVHKGVGWNLSSCIR